MTADNCILTCSYNRRRTRASQHNDESTMQTTKPKHASLKSRMEPQPKHSLVSENISTRWSSADKEVRTPAEGSESESAARRLPIFRQQVNIDDDDDDMFVLKRANPVYDSDDEDYFCSPSKRQRTAEPTCLDWEERLSECESNGFTLTFSSVLQPR